MAFTRLLFHVGASFGTRQACRFAFVALEHSVRMFNSLSRFPSFLSVGGGHATTPSSSQTKAVCLGLVTSLMCLSLRWSTLWAAKLLPLHVFHLLYVFIPFPLSFAFSIFFSAGRGHATALCWNQTGIVDLGPMLAY